MPYRNEHSLRLLPPGDFLAGTYRRKEVTPGISFIFAKRTWGGAMETQAIRFDARRIDLLSAAAWAAQHGYSGTIVGATG